MVGFFHNTGRIAVGRHWLWLVVMLLCLPGRSQAVDLVKYSLCDVRVLYLYDQAAEEIDWPTLYYLNDHFGCRIDLLTVQPREIFGCHHREVPDRELFGHQFFLPDTASTWIDSVLAVMFSERRPDIVLMGDIADESMAGAVSRALVALTPTPDRLFAVQKIYQRRLSEVEVSREPWRVILNGNELLSRYRDRMANEIPSLVEGYAPDHLTSSRLVTYELIKSSVLAGTGGTDFLSGIKPMRLADILQQRLNEGPRRTALWEHARRFVSSTRAALSAAGRVRVDLIVEGYRHLRDLTDYGGWDDQLQTLADFEPYLRELSAKTERATLDAVGLDWQGKITTRGSPHGPRLKYVAALSANGPRSIELTEVRFHPYWDTLTVFLDSTATIIAPHQSYVREYLIEVDRERLEARQPESLLFSAEIKLGSVSLVFVNSLPVWEAPEMQVTFEPDYYFIPPVARIDVDRVVSSLTLRAILSKPPNFSGLIQLNLETPRGLFAGAYRQEIRLDQGDTRETVRIPFSVSNLFELGIQQLYLTLSVDGKTIATDTAQIRIASCKIADTIKIGLMPDTTGRLEDILRMTEAAFQPLTDRALQTADLDAYNVIVIGSGAFRQYPSFREARDRFEDYLRHGGSIVVMGQPEDWPEGALPFTVSPETELVDRAGITNLIPQARILSQPYDISEGNLLSSFYKKRRVITAAVLPAEKVYVCPSGGTILSISRLGEGQVIYCGFPLLELISQLKIDAIHLLANILNY
ncbi:MAG: hypothetical protein ABII79_08035 [bacterium]